MADAKKGWTIYLVVFGVLVLLLVYTQVRQKEVELSVEPIFEVDVDRVTEFTVSGKSSSVTLVKRDTTWFFAPPDTGTAGKSRIVAFFKDVVGGRRESHVTEDTAKYGRYNVAEGQAVRLELRAGEAELGVIWVGRSSDYTREYLRYPDDPRVYLVHQPLLSRLATSAAGWR
jgi:hypothetical protein